MRANDAKENKRGGSNIRSSTKLPPVNLKHPVPANFSLNAKTHEDEGLISILHQYFIKNNYFETLETFQKDCVRNTKPTLKTHQQLKRQLMTLFQNGKREDFMHRFNQFVPLSMRTKDIATIKMEFFVMFYFYIYPTHPFLGKKRNIDATTKQHFTNYLEKRGSVLSKSREFNQYFAMTNIQKPQQNPLYKPIFTKQWVVQIKKRLAYFLQKLYPASKTPTLITMYDRFVENLERSNFSIEENDDDFEIEEVIVQEDDNINPQPILHQKNQNSKQMAQQSLKNELESQQFQMLKLRNQQLEYEKNELISVVENYKGKYQNLQNSFKEFSEGAQATLMQSQSKWFKITQQIYAITDELLGVCRKLQQGFVLEDVNIVEKIAQKLSKYDKFIKMNIQDLFSDNVDFSVFQRPENDASVDLARNRNTRLMQLDYLKIAKCFAEPEKEDEKQNDKIAVKKIVLLQALKWRISKTRGIFSKRQAVVSLTMYDVLGIKRNDKTLEKLLKSKNVFLALQTACLVNTLTKDYYGREYLVCQELMVPCIEAIKNSDTLSQIKEQLFMAFEWLSIRKQASNFMTNNDMIKFVVEKLDKQRQTIPSPLMEYIITLLLNLLLHKQGAQKAEEIKSFILKTLINLIESESMSIRSYVHGCIFPLLSLKSFRQQAKNQFALENMIDYLLENSEPQSQHEHQLRYLKQQLQIEEDDVPEEDEEKVDQDELNDDDELGDEGQYNNDVTVNGIKGEQLLVKQYLLMGPDSISQMNTIKEKVEITLRNKPIQLDNSFFERQSVNTPLLGKMKRNISNNNSVYSNKSSNRILKSQKNSRSQTNNKGTRQKLDTVHQNNSEVSLQNEPKRSDRILEGIHNEEHPQETFRNFGAFNQSERKQNNNQRQNLENQQENQPQQNQENIGTEVRQIKVKKDYQKHDQYKVAFETRAKIVRTPRNQRS